jgi:hypothetical protein
MVLLSTAAKCRWPPFMRNDTRSAGGGEIKVLTRRFGNFGAPLLRDVD